MTGGCRAAGMHIHWLADGLDPDLSLTGHAALLKHHVGIRETT
jgi:hypothetical protein